MGSRSIRGKHILLVGIVSVVTFGVIITSHESMLGNPPSGSFSPEQHAAEMTYQDPDLERLRQATRVRPKERIVWMSLAEELLRKASKNVISRQEASLEAIGALREVLNLNAKDSQALLLMADISFEMQAFTKATEFYEQYLQEKPDDDFIRSRYASSLTFTGRAQEAEKILREVIERNPNAFQPRAFLAFAFAEQGRTEEMNKAGEEALALASDEQARVMLTSFLEKMRGKQAPSDASMPRASSVETKIASPQPPNAEESSSALKIMNFLSKNPVAGPKLRSFQESQATLRIFLETFPMEAMPPFAREKFLGGIKDFLREEKITDFSLIEFRDLESGRLEGTLAIDQ